MPNAHVHPLMAAILQAHGVTPRSHTTIAMCAYCHGDLSEPCEGCGSRGYVEVNEHDLPRTQRVEVEEDES